MNRKILYFKFLPVIKQNSGNKSIGFVKPFRISYRTGKKLVKNKACLLHLLVAGFTKPNLVMPYWAMPVLMHIYICGHYQFSL